jgi:K+-transporting ATPase ATPase C chain
METQPQPQRSLFSLIRPALLISLWLCLLTGLVYPLVTTGIANVLFPYQAKGSLITVNGKVIGSESIGQNFTRPEYFTPRPSATNGTDSNGKTIPQPYNAANSSGSNLGPTNQALIKNVQDAAAIYRKINGLAADAPVPVDAVTSSSSGLDPDISVANATLQANRVAQARGLTVEQVQDLIRQNTTGRQLGLLGEPRVNVLKLNLALDTLKPVR